MVDDDFDETGLAFANNTGTLRLKQTNLMDFDGVVGDDDALGHLKDGLHNKKRGGPTSIADSDAEYGISKEIYNFSSAPQNAKSAFQGNQALKDRYD